MVDTFLMRLPVASGMKEQAQRAGKSELQAQRLSVEAGGRGLGALYSRSLLPWPVLVTQGGPLCYAWGPAGFICSAPPPGGFSVDGRTGPGAACCIESPPSVEMEPNQALRPAGSS